MNKPERFRDNPPTLLLDHFRRILRVSRVTRDQFRELGVKRELDFAQPFRLPRCGPPIPRALPWAVIGVHLRRDGPGSRTRLFRTSCRSEAEPR